MNAERKNTDDEIRQLLRRGDPAGDGETLAPDEVARLRRKILAEIPSERPRGWRPAWALGLSVAAAAVLVSIVVFIWTPSSPLRTDRRPVGSHTSATDLTTRGVRTQERAVQQIQFVTPGGTRVIWTLDPDFDV